jgi:SAM-dependent methyltransferase
MTTSATPGRAVLGTAAESHERFRPGYPDEVVDRTLAFARRRVAGAVEIGAGTGKAARAFASRGVRVTALESDPEMFAVLQRETLGMQVEPVPCGLEEYDGPQPDLVYAATSWHRTDPRTRCVRAAGLLPGGGVLAVFGSTVEVIDPRVRATVERLAAPYQGDDAGVDLSREVRHELGSCGLFTGTREHVVVRRVLRPQREYVGYLSTVAGYLMLPLESRQRVLHLLAEILPAQVPLELTFRLHLARR